MKIAAITELTPKPEWEIEILNASKNIQKAALTETGLLHFSLCRKKDNPNTLVFYEIFENQSALDNHMKEEHTNFFIKFIEDKCEETKVTFLEILE